MKLVFLGDLVGRSGREVVLNSLEKIKTELKPDFIIANGENAAGGFGITKSVCEELFAEGVDVITTGNHVWDQSGTASYIAQEKRLLRPINYSNPQMPGQGAVSVQLKDGRRFIVMNVMCRLFMHENLECPFRTAENYIKQFSLESSQIAGIFVDLHGEATSEKKAFAIYLDGKVSGVIGTHTHVPTTDAQVLSGGTAYLTDAGMCGDYNSIIGMKPNEPLARFLGSTERKRMQPALGEGTLSGALINIDDKTGLAQSIFPIILGPHLHNQWPAH
jgi:hypothetical protein